jgi:hypothetical protein
MKLDKELIARLNTPMWNTWNAIGHDVYACAEECGESLDNEEAVESCIDANRLWLNGDDKAADDLIHELCREHGYHVVLKFLTKHYQLA